MKTLEKGFALFSLLMDWFCRCCFILIFVAVFAVTIARYFFAKSPLWVEELVSLAMAWLYVVGGVLAHRNGLAFRIGIVTEKLPASVQKLIAVIEDIICTACCVILIPPCIYSFKDNAVVPMVGLPFSKQWLYAGMCVLIFGYIVVNVERYILKLTGNKLINPSDLEKEE